ncbi:TolC family protein [Legionella dresdenensis]|uniref:TolC family protein n=1 Tax=Legionella dresdenensis TaxID=450200 RepID=A0ABV8CHW1_9GAMM
MRLGVLSLLVASVIWPISVAASLFTFQQAIIIAWKNNPDLQAAIDKSNVQKGKVLQSGLYPNPFFLLQGEDFGGSGVYKSYESAETTFSITQPIPLGNRLHYLKNAAYADYLTAIAAINVKKSAIYRDVGSAYIDTYYAGQWYAVTQKLTRLHKNLVAEIKRRLQAGAGAQLDLKLAEIRLGEAVLNQRRALVDLKVAKAALTRVLGSAIPAHSEFSDKGLRHRSWPWKVIKKQMDQSPALIGKRLQLEAQRKRIIAVKKAVWPDLMLQAGARHFSDDGSNAAVMSVGAEMPVFDRNQGKIAAGYAQYNQICYELKSLRLQLEHNLYQLAVNAENSAYEAEQVTKVLLPHAREAIDYAQKGYKLGRYSYFELSAAMNAVFEEEKHYQQAHAQLHKAYIQIAGILGRDDAAK